MHFCLSISLFFTLSLFPSESALNKNFYAQTDRSGDPLRPHYPRCPCPHLPLSVYLPQLEACLKHKSCTVCQWSNQRAVQGDTCNVFICRTKWAGAGVGVGTERIGWTGEAVAPHRQCDPDSKNTTPLQPKRSNKAKPKCLNVFYINLILFHLLSSAEATQEGEEQEEKRGEHLPLVLQSAICG